MGRQLQSIYFFTGLISLMFILNSCGDDEKIIDEMLEPCENVEFTGNMLDFKGETYNISEYSYSDFFVLNHNFKFKAFDDDCNDSLSVNLDFSHSISFPDFSLAGDYTTKFTTNFIELDLEEMTGTFQLDSGSQYILSGGTATISEPDDSSYLITVDSPTSSLTGGTKDTMKLSVIVDKQ